MTVDPRFRSLVARASCPWILLSGQKTRARAGSFTGGAFTETARVFLDTLEPGRHIEKPFDLKSLRALINEKIK